MLKGCSLGSISKPDAVSVLTVLDVKQVTIVLHNGFVNVWHGTPDRAFMHVMIVGIERR